MRKKSFHPISWRNITKSKEERGLGLFSLRDINKALMCKNRFQLIQRKEKKLGKWIDANNYFVNDLLQYKNLS